MPSIRLQLDLHTSYGREVLRGALRYANRHTDWRCLVQGLSVELDREPRPWRACDGAIVHVRDPQLAWELQDSGLLLVNTASMGLRWRLPTVTMDDVAAGRAVARHLLRCRFRRFAYLGWGTEPVVEERAAGFTDELEQAGCAVERFRPRSRRQLGRQLGDWVAALPRPVGVLAATDQQARELSEVCARRGIGIPDELALIGVDDHELLCEVNRPPVRHVVGALHLGHYCRLRRSPSG